MNRRSQRRTTVARDRGRPLGLATPTGLSAGRQLPSQPPVSRVSGERRSVHMRDAHSHRRSAQGNLLAPSGGARTASANPPGLLFYGNTMTVTGVDMDRIDNPDVSQQPQFGLAPQGFAIPFLYGVPVNMGTMTVTGVDMNRNDNPDVLPRSQSVLAPQGFATPVPNAAPVNIGTMTMTGADMSRDGSPGVLQQPQIGIAHKGLAALVQHGAPVNIGMTTMTGVDVNCDGIPNLLQQPQSGLPTKSVKTWRTNSLLSVASFLTETRTLSSSTWSTNFWNGCTKPTHRNSPMMLGRPSLTFTTFGAALDTSISRSTTAMRERITASLVSSTALPSGILWCPCAGTSAGPHHAEEVLELVVSPLGHVNIP